MRLCVAGKPAAGRWAQHSLPSWRSEPSTAGCSQLERAHAPSAEPGQKHSGSPSCRAQQPWAPLLCRLSKGTVITGLSRWVGTPAGAWAANRVRAQGGQAGRRQAGSTRVGLGLCALLQVAPILDAPCLTFGSIPKPCPLRCCTTLSSVPGPATPGAHPPSGTWPRA